jgi:hypothetical protein
MSKIWMTSICAGLLLSGCVTKTHDPLCAVIKPIWFGSQATVDWLMLHDKLLVRDVVAQSEVIQSTCQ